MLWPSPLANPTPLAVRQDGTLWAFGQNTSGQLGDGSTTQRLTPAQVQALASVVGFDGGISHNVALLADGTVWGWVSGALGQMDDGSTAGRMTPATVASSVGDVYLAAAGDFYTLTIVDAP